MARRNQKAAEKPKDFNATARKLFSLIKGNGLQIVMAIIMAMASAAFSILGPKYLGNITTMIFNGVTNASGRIAIDFAAILNTILFLLTLYCLSTVLRYLQGVIMVNIAHKTSKNLRQQLSEKIHSLPLSYYDKIDRGDIISRVSNDIDVINQTLSQGMSELIVSLTAIIGVVIMMLSINWQMTLVAALIIPVSGFLTAFIVKKTQKYFKARQETLGELNGHIEEMISNHQVIKAFNGEQSSLNSFTIKNEKLYNSAWKAQFLSGLLMPLMSVLSNLSYVLITLLGANLAIQGIISVGDIQAFLQYLKMFSQPLVQLSNVSNILQQTMASAERIFEFLEAEEEKEHYVEKADPEQIKGHISFKKVYFAYNNEQMIIKNFSSDFQQGSKVAIVGPTGSGKTTLVKLLMRYYDVTQGEILIDGININNFSRPELRSKFAMVLQDTWLFNGTIMENIAYGNLNASSEQIIQAAKQANVDHFVKVLPDGYQTMINEETSNLSAGQKQLLTIARAILAEPKILIFDEATSSVDTRTELHIQEAMDNLMAGRTSFVIAHRLSTIKNADIILVLDDGDIVEQGKHQELLQKQGFYAKLYQSQFDTED